MIQELETFAYELNEKWKKLPKVDILKNIEEHVHNSRSKNFADLHDLKNDFGIYVFFIKPGKYFSNTEQLEKLWNLDGFKKYPKIVKKRFMMQQCCDAGWFTFYIGKGEKLKNRVQEHINHNATHATYGLKLKDRKQFLKENDIEIGYWHLPEMREVPREIKQFIITNMESALRDEMLPWIGKQ